MADIRLKNKTIEIGVDFQGAEMKSLKRLDTEKEYLWCADPKYWGRTSPILFPFIGSLKEKQYRYENRDYPMGQHGFARDKRFQLLSQTEDEVWFFLEDDEDSRSRFPFRFRLEIGYRLQDNGVSVSWRVVNPGETELYFSIGAHPAFNCPLGEEQQTDCGIRFQTADGKNLKDFSCTVLGENGLVTAKKEKVELQDGILPVREDLFDIDTFIIEDSQVKKVSLVNAQGKDYLTVTFAAPVVGIWSPPGKQAPFICIEPWYGRCDGEYFKGELKEREWGNSLAPGGVFEADYQIIL